MDYKFLFHNLIKIIFTPGKAWTVIAEENRPAKFLRNNFLLPMIILVSVASFIGCLIFTNKTFSPLYPALTGIKYFILLLSVNYLSAVILGEITKPLDLGKDFTVSFRLIVYSLTPLFICQIISNLFESLIFVNILSLWGLYIFWSGAEKMLNPPDYKKMPLLISVFIVLTVIFFACNWIVTSFADRVYFSFLHHLHK
jgi:Yip1 domain